MIQFCKLAAVLKESGKTWNYLHHHNISFVTIIKLRKGYGVLDTRVIDCICGLLDCQPGDIMEYVKPEHSKFHSIQRGKEKKLKKEFKKSKVYLTDWETIDEASGRLIWIELCNIPQVYEYASDYIERNYSNIPIIIRPRPDIITWEDIKKIIDGLQKIG